MGNESSDNKGKLNVENGDSQESELTDTQQPNEPVIRYEQELYPGIITEIKDTGVKVKTICKSGPNHWKWTKDDAKIWYSFD
ncbi:hypothetical protein JTB14_001833 [Gonioctena quinquepunctata]|nr:hypothetical protein JTB14_001833 [Gonioctena quinquepunctata]